jgi:hypothetical protein
MKRYIKPVAHKAGITKNIDWHTFRHSFGTLLKANGEDIKTVQELLRYANSRITLGRLHAGSDLEQAGRTEQACKDDGSERGHTKRQRGHNGFREDCCQFSIAGSLCPYRARISLSLRSKTSHESFGMCGEDDGARTRDLCRDSK